MSLKQPCWVRIASNGQLRNDRWKEKTGNRTESLTQLSVKCLASSEVTHNLFGKFYAAADELLTYNVKLEEKKAGDFNRAKDVYGFYIFLLGVHNTGSL